MMKKMSRAAAFAAVFCLGTFNFVLAAEKIDINTAPLEELVKIIHIGEVRAKELISLRPFSSLDDLARIKGIGESRVKDIKVQGLAWVEAPTEAAKKAAENSSPLTEELSEEAAATATEPASWFVFLIAGALAIFSGIIILVLKKGIK